MNVLRAIYYSRFGPTDGPMLMDYAWTNVAVFVDSDVSPVGVAEGRGWTQYRGEKAMLFRLVVGGVELPGLWVCDGRQFFDLSDTAHE